jgi:hypothetical protein
MTVNDVDPGPLQIGRISRVRVASRHDHAASDEELGQRTHPRASDADEMNGTTIVRRDERHVSAKNIPAADAPLKSESALHRAR